MKPKNTMMSMLEGPTSICSINSETRSAMADSPAGDATKASWKKIRRNSFDSAPNARLCMSELSKAALFTRSGLTRLVDRIEEAGLVRRERIAGDRRGASVVLTAAGREKFEKAFEGHRATVEQAFSSKMSPRQWRQVGKALEVFYS